MLCGKCNYYFCWVCGGDGYKCGSYFCKNNGVRTYGKDETTGYASGQRAMAEQISSIEQYSDAVMNLDDCIKSIATDANEISLRRNYELQLRKNLTWLRGFLVDNSLSSCKKKQQSCIKDVATKTELALGFLTNTFDTDEIDQVLKDEEIITRPKKRNYNYKKKQVSKPLKNEMKNYHEYDERKTSLTKIFEMEKIRSLNDRQFNAHISTVLSEAMQQLMYTGRSKKKFVDKKEIYALDLLNKREKELKAPWKGESRFEAPKMIVRDMSTKLQDKLKNSSQKKLQWKGKSKVNARRIHALRQLEIEI